MYFAAALVRPREPGTTSARTWPTSEWADRATLGIECAARITACPNVASFRAMSARNAAWYGR